MSDNNPDLVAQEVDEDLRRDQLNALWKNYGKYIIGAAIGISLTVAGREIYTAHIQSTQEENARTFDSAAQTSLNGDAVSIWSNATAKLSGSYSTLASLQLAAAQAKAGDTDSALATYTSLATSSGIDPVFADLANFQASILLIQKEAIDEAKSRLSLVTVKGKPWYYGAQEQLAYLEMKTGNSQESLSLFTLLAEDNDTPASIKNRAATFRSMLEQELAQAAPVSDESEETDNEG